MQKVEIIKPYQSYRVGDVITVTQNVAHGLVSIGVAKIFGGYPDKMMRPESKGERRRRLRLERSRGYKVK